MTRAFTRNCLTFLCFSFLILASTFAFHHRPAKHARTPKPPLAKSHASYAASIANMPLAFEPNEGQSRADTLFLARSHSFQLRLNSSETILALPSHKNSNRRASPPSLLHLRLQNSRLHPQLRPLDPLPTKINYFKPSGSIPNVPTFAKVEYENVYPGINLAFHGTEGHLEYDFMVAPGADPKSIRLNFSGARNIHLASNGDLILETPAGPLVQHKPVLYQGSGSSRHEIAGSYRQLSSNLVALNVGSYDKSQTLVIDPTLEYAASFDPGPFPNGAYGSAIAVDSTGNAYITGFAPDLSVSGGTGSCYQTPPPSRNCAEGFVDKLSADGTTLIYQTNLANAGGYSIAVDAAGDVYVVGAAEAPGFGIATNGVQQNPPAGTCPIEPDLTDEIPCPHAFVVVLDPTGANFLYSTYLGSSATDTANGVAIDSANLIYITGFVGKPDFPTTANAFQKTFNTDSALSAIFVAKIDPTKVGGASLIYSTFLGGAPAGTPITDIAEEGNGIAVDQAGDAFVAGLTDSTNIATPGALQTKLPKIGTSFVTKLNPSGSKLIWSTYLGGTDSTLPEHASAIAIDGAGNSYVTGVATTTDFPTTAGAFDTDLKVPSKAFVSKLNASGSGLIYSTLLGSNISLDNIAASNAQAPTGLAVDANGDVFVTGNAILEYFPIGSSTLLPFCNESAAGTVPNCDVFLSELDPAGKTLLFSSYLFGNTSSGIALDSTGNAYVIGLGAVLLTNPPPGLSTGTGIFVDKVNLTATGPAVLITPNALAFDPIASGKTSAAQTALLENLGNGPLDISSIAANNDFTQKNNCPPQLAAGARCTLSVTYTANNNALQNETGTLTVADSAFGSPHHLNLYGGLAGAIGSPSTGQLNFPDQLVGASSAPRGVTLLSQGTATMSPILISASGDYAETTNCGNTLAVGNACQISVSFSPTAVGSRIGSVSVIYGSSGSTMQINPVSVELIGNGVAIPLFVTASSSSATVTAGQTATYTLQLKSSAGINEKITLACFDIPNASTCSAPSVALNGATPVSEKISVSTTAHSLAPPNALPNKIVPQRPLWAALSVFLAIATVALFFLTKAHQTWRAVILCAGSLILCAMLSNCGGSGGGGSGGGSTGTPSGSYHLTVNVSAGGTTKSVPLTLIVQ